jgi:Rieske 2Fe-2S family protein
MNTPAKVQQLLGQRRPGFSLPQPFYVDPDIYKFDVKAIFETSWLMVGFEVELPDAGSYISLTIGTSPIIVLRDRERRVRAFFNSCRHRGAQICKPGEGKVRRLVCPYHQWTYDLDGKLLFAKDMQSDFDASEFPLKPVHVETVAGSIYICLADNPPPFAEFKEAVEPLLLPHNLLEAKIAHQCTLVEKANWKLVMENARECYHCSACHPELATSFPIESTAYFEDGDGALQRFQERMVSANVPIGPVEGTWWQAIRFPLRDGCVSVTRDGGPAVKKLMCETENGDIGSMRWALEPHSFAHAVGDYTFMFSAYPTGPEETIVVGKWLVHKDAVEGIDYDIPSLTEVWDATNREDRDLAENNQIGVNSIGYTPGPYNRVPEELIIRFTDWYCDKASAFSTEQLRSSM